MSRGGRCWLGAGGLLLAVAVVAGCGAGPCQPLAVGAGDSAESQVLAAIYAQALDRSGTPARVQSGLGDRAGTLAALDAGAISLLPEHNGALLAHFDDHVPARAMTLKQLTTQLSGTLPQGLTIFDAADGTDMRPQLLIPRARAQALNVSTVTDLAPHCSTLKAGYSPIPGLLSTPTVAQKIADCDFTSEENFPSPAALLTALRTGRIDIAVLGGPTELLPNSDLTDLTTLSDPKHAIRSENVLPVLRQGTLAKPQLQQLSKVAGELTTPDLAAMTITHEPPGEAARTWLDAHNL